MILLMSSCEYCTELLGLGELWVTCSPRDPSFEVRGQWIFQDVKILNTSPLGGTLSRVSRHFRII